MRVISDVYGNRFLEVENKADFEKLKKDMLDKAGKPFKF